MKLKKENFVTELKTQVDMYLWIPYSWIYLEDPDYFWTWRHYWIVMGLFTI